jgi:hypothetical protein
MRLRGWIAGAALGACAAGCMPVPSLHPLVEAGEGVEVPGIVGAWGDSASVLRIRQVHEDHYYVTNVDSDSSTVRFDAWFVKLHGRLFADLVADIEPGAELSGPPFLLPMHTIFRVDLAGDSLRLAFLDDEWVRKALDDHRVKARHERLENDVVLTDDSRGLRAMVEKIANESAAFDTSGGFLRRR